MEKDLRLGYFESLSGSLGESGAGHAFAKAAFFEEILLEPPELLVEKVAGQLGVLLGGDYCGPATQRQAIHSMTAPVKDNRCQ
jgi:hypothetical protein